LLIIYFQLKKKKKGFNELYGRGKKWKRKRNGRRGLGHGLLHGLLASSYDYFVALFKECSPFIVAHC
jgi:hypothetical protein